MLEQIDTCDKEFMENQNAMKRQAETAERIQQTKRRPPESYYEDGLRKPPHQLEPDHVGYHRPPRRRGPPYYLCGDMKYKGECPRGNECTFAHSLEEKKRWVMDFGRVESKAMYDEDVCRPMPDVNSFNFDHFTMCFNFDCEQGCSYGLNCNFAHTDRELDDWNQELAALQTEREMAAHSTLGDHVGDGNDGRGVGPAAAVEKKLLLLIVESPQRTIKCNQILDQYRWRFREQLDYRGAGHEKLSDFLKSMPRITYDPSGGLGYERVYEAPVRRDTEPGEDDAGGQAEAKGQDAADDDDQADGPASAPPPPAPPATQAVAPPAAPPARPPAGAGGRAEPGRLPEGWEANDAW